MTFKSSVNFEHVEALKQLMRETVGKLNMDFFFYSREYQVGKVLNELRNPLCETKACIAGYCTLLSLNPVHLRPTSGDVVVEQALDYLGVSREVFGFGCEFAEWLFFQWPIDLDKRYRDALSRDNPAEAVEVACEAIDRYIAEYQKAEQAAWLSPIAIDEDAVERANLSTQP